MEGPHAVRIAVPSHPELASLPGGGPLRLGDGRSTELDGPVVCTRQHGTLGGALHHDDPVHRPGRGASPALPKLERAFVVPPSLRERVDLLGGRSGRGQRRDGANDVARRDPVVRELRRRDGDPADLPAPLQFATERGMQAVALAVEQFAVGDLGQQRVAEGVPAQTVDVAGSCRRGSPG